MAASCYGTLFPAYIKESGINTGDAELLSIVINPAETNLYVGGYSKAVGLFTGVAPGQYPFAGNYQISTGQYSWSKIYFDLTGNVQFDAVNLKPNNSVLALAGSTADKMTLFVYLVDPDTGAQLYPYFTVGLDYPATLLNDQSLLFTAGSRLYLTPEFYRGAGAANLDGSWSTDAIQTIAVQYTTTGIMKLWQWHSTGGSSANLINVLPNAADGFEKVLMGGGVSIGANNAFVLALYLISPVDGSISQINLQYGAGGTLFTDQTVYHYFARTKIEGSKLYAVTRSAKQDARGTATYYCVFQFKDATFTQLGTFLKCASQNAVPGYSKTQIVLDMIPATDIWANNMHLIAYDSEFQRLLYLRLHLNSNPATAPDMYQVLQLVTGQPYKAAMMADLTPTKLYKEVYIRQAYAVGGTSQFLSYALPMTNTAKMPYINAIHSTSTCTTQSPWVTQLYLNPSGSEKVIYTWISVVAQQSTFQTVQSFSSNTVRVSTANFKTQNLNFNSISTCSLCRSYSTVTMAAGSFANQILDKSFINIPQTSTFTPNKATNSACTTPNAWVYTIDESSLNLSYDIFAVNSVTNKIQMVLRDCSLAVGNYPMTVVGTLPNLQTKSFTFTLQIVMSTASCASCAQSAETTLAVTSAALTNQVYTIFDATLLYVTPAYSVTSAYCTVNDIVYSMTVTPATTGQSTSFLTFESATRTVSVCSAVNTDAGTFIVDIEGTVTNNLGTQSTVSSFTLTVNPLLCSQSSDILSITADPSFQNGQILTYSITSATVSLQLPAFVVHANYCTEVDVQQTMTVTPVTSGQSFAFIAFDAAQRTISVFSSAQSDAGSFTVQIDGTVTNQLGIVLCLRNYIFTVSATTSCSLSSDSITIATEPSFETVQSFEYIIGNEPQSIKIPPYLLTGTYCSQSDITYNQTITTSPSSLPKSQFTFTEATQTTSWYSTNIKHVGYYIVTTEASLTNLLGTQTASVIYNLTFIAPVNQPPVLLNYTSSYYDINEGQSIQLGPVYDPDQDQTVKVAYSVVPTNKRITFKDGVLTIHPNVKVGDYAVTIILTDSFTINPGVSIYTLLLNKTMPIVNPLPSNITTLVNHTETEFKSQSHFYSKMTVNQAGLCTVYFSELLTTPFNFTMFNVSQLQIHLLPPFSVDPNLLEFTWNLTEFTPSYMQIQIYFENPLYVSSKSRFEKDTLQIILVDPLKFISLVTHTTMANMTNISQSVPAQFASQYDYAIMSEIVKYTTIILATVIITTFVLNLFLHKLLQDLWAMVNCLQIIAYMTFFNVFLPANAQLFFEMILNTANFNIIPVESIYATLFPFLQAAESDAELEIYQQVQVLLLSAVQMVLLVPVIIVAYYLKRRSTFFERVYEYFNYSIFWNGTIRYVMESYMSFTHFAVVIMVSNLSFETATSRAQSVCVVIIFTLYVAIPGIVTMYFRRKITLFRSNMFLNRFSDIMGNLNWRNVASTNAIALFCYRRLIQVILIVLLKDYPYAQVQLMAELQTLVVIIFGFSYVYHLPSETRLEYFDDVTIMFCIYHYFALTNFVDDPLVKYNVGYSLIATSLLNLAVHLMLVVHSDITAVIRKLKQWRQRIRMIIHRIKQSMKRPKKSILKASTKYPQDDEPQSPTVQKKTVTFYIESDFISGESSESPDGESSESPNSDSIESSESPREESKSEAPQLLLGQDNSLTQLQWPEPVPIRKENMTWTKYQAQQNYINFKKQTKYLTMVEYLNSLNKITNEAKHLTKQNIRMRAPDDYMHQFVFDSSGKQVRKPELGERPKLRTNNIQQWDDFNQRLQNLKQQDRVINDLQRQTQQRQSHYFLPIDSPQEQMSHQVINTTTVKRRNFLDYADDDQQLELDNYNNIDRFNDRNKDGHNQMGEFDEDDFR